MMEYKSKLPACPFKRGEFPCVETFGVECADVDKCVKIFEG